MGKRAAVIALTLFVALAVPALNAQNPVPLINQPPEPASIAPGGSGFNLTINGTGFASGAVVNWNGSPRVTVFVSSSQVTAGILATDLAAPSTASITVVNPAPGGGTSNSVFFQVTDPVTTVAFAPLHYAGYTGGWQQFAAADINRDGKLDLVLIGPPTTVIVMLGNGDGTFQAPQSIQAGVPGESIALADFNGDGKLDVAVTGLSEVPVVSILLGNGDGTFQPSQMFGTDYPAYRMAIGDFNRDGKLDIATMDSNSRDYVSVLLGNGDGTFQASVNFPAGADLQRSLYTGDFNRDGKLDLAVTGNSGTSILFGNGDGTFQPATAIPGSFELEAIADFNGDGILDLAATPSGTRDTVIILLGNGDGTFQPPISSVAGQGLGMMVTGDFNGDGKPDLAVTVGAGSQEAVAVLFGNGDGTFQAPVLSMALRQPDYLIAGDFNGDGKLDLATNTYANDKTTLDILLQTSVGLSPANLSFAPQLLGTTSAPVTVTLTNNGTSTLSVAGLSLSGHNPGDFAIADDQCSGAGVPAGGTCEFTVAFTPGAQGSRLATISVTDNGPASPQQIFITGNGTVLKFSQNVVNFGAVKIGSASAPKVVVVTNTSTSEVELNAISVDGADPGDFIEGQSCGEYLAASASCAIEVTFTPTADGTRTAYVKVGYAQAAPTKIGLKGTGT